MSRSEPRSVTQGWAPSLQFLELALLYCPASGRPPLRASRRGQPHPAVFIWHHNSSASLADFFSLLSSVSTLMSWI